MQRTSNSLVLLASIFAGMTATQGAVHADPILFSYTVSATPQTLGGPNAFVSFSPAVPAGLLDATTVGSIDLFSISPGATSGVVSFAGNTHTITLRITDVASDEVHAFPIPFALDGWINNGNWWLIDRANGSISGSAEIGGHLYSWSLVPADQIEFQSPTPSGLFRVTISVVPFSGWGACCHADLTCTLERPGFFGCFGLPHHGVGTDCSMVTCEPFITCCVFDVGCLPVSAAECSQLGGIEHESWFPGCTDWSHACHPDFPPIFQNAPAPVNFPRTRYVSFHVPWGYLMAIRVRRTLPLPIVELGWLDFPSVDGHVAIVPDPVFDWWPIPFAGQTLHISGCDVIPGAAYEIAPTQGFGSGWYSVSVVTVPKPADKDWGDLVGPFNGTAWPAPDGFANVHDVLAVLAFIRQTPGAPHFTVVNVQAQSAIDPCLNDFVNVGDLFAIVRAVGGAPYPFTTDPTQCPPCP